MNKIYHSQDIKNIDIKEHEDFMNERLSKTQKFNINNSWIDDESLT